MGFSCSSAKSLTWPCCLLFCPACFLSCLWPERPNLFFGRLFLVSASLGLQNRQSKPVWETDHPPPLTPRPNCLRRCSVWRRCQSRLKTWCDRVEHDRLERGYRCIPSFRIPTCQRSGVTHTCGAKSWERRAPRMEHLLKYFVPGK